jgi:catechol 2,3-dioxygenase-like lactoylglutathione lyase family enzyme
MPIRSVVTNTTDLDRSVAFYGDVLELPATAELQA